jgi:hypothetical protein
MQRSDKRLGDAHVIIRDETMLVVIGTREMTVAEAAELAGLPATAVRSRLHKGWTAAEALTRPVMPPIAPGGPGDARGRRRAVRGCDGEIAGHPPASAMRDAWRTAPQSANNGMGRDRHRAQTRMFRPQPLDRIQMRTAPIDEPALITLAKRS